MRVRNSSRLDCESLCLDVHVPLVKVCLQEPLCSFTQHYPARGFHANLRVLLANIRLQAPVVVFVSATLEHEADEIMCV